MVSEQTTFSLPAQRREEEGKKVTTLRRAGKLPAVIYGHGVKNTNLLLDYKRFERVYQEAGGSSLVDLQIDTQKPVKVVIQEVQKDPLTDRYLHVDFHQVRMTEKISAEVTLKFIGESKAVKEGGGILVKNLDTLKTECLPQDLIHVIEVDITKLQTFEDIIRVADLPIPSGITVKEKAEVAVVRVQPPRTEEELKALEEKPEEEKVEEVEPVVKKKEEEVVEGEVAAGAPEETGAKKKEEK